MRFKIFLRLKCEEIWSGIKLVPKGIAIILGAAIIAFVVVGATSVLVAPILHYAFRMPWGDAFEYAPPCTLAFLLFIVLPVTAIIDWLRDNWKKAGILAEQQKQAAPPLPQEEIES